MEHKVCVRIAANNKKEQKKKPKIGDQSDRQSIKKMYTRVLEKVLTATKNV